VTGYVLGTDDVEPALRAVLAKLHRAVVDAAVETVAYGEAKAVALTNKEDLVDQGIYKNSWQHRRRHDGGELRNDTPYAAVIEWGRRPKRPGPPFDPIFEWVQRKLVGRGEVAPEDAVATASMIAASIHHKGTKPRFVLRDTVRIMRKRFPKEIRRQIRRRKGRR
jgi:hypothetical protein